MAMSPVMMRRVFVLLLGVVCCNPEHGLARAIENDDVAGVKKALAAGASPNATISLVRDDNAPALCHSVNVDPTLATDPAAARHDAISLALIDAGADPNTLCKLGGPASGWSVLYGAAQRGKADVVRALIDKGADKNFAPAGQPLPLCEAALRGEVETVVVLKEAGASRECGLPPSDIISSVRFKASGETNPATRARYADILAILGAGT